MRCPRRVGEEGPLLGVYDPGGFHRVRFNVASCFTVSRLWTAILLVLKHGENIYYPPEVSSMKYCCLGVFRKEYFRLVSK